MWCTRAPLLYQQLVNLLTDLAVHVDDERQTWRLTPPCLELSNVGQRTPSVATRRLPKISV